MAIKKVTTKKPLKKAQPGLSVTTGTNPKNNANAKLAAGIGTALGAIGLAANKIKKRRAAKLAAKEAKNSEDTVKQKYGGSTKKRK